MSQWSSSSDSTLVDTASSINSKHKSRQNVRKAKVEPGSDIEAGVEGASVERSPSIQSGSSLVSWDGDDDPENPRNLKCIVKLAISIVISLLNFVVSIAISLFSGVLQEGAFEFGDGMTEDLTLSLYILGLALGPIFFGPASECYGRKRPLVFGMMGFSLFTFFVITSRNVEAILFCRFLAGACGSAAYVIPPGMFVDLYGPVGRAIAYQIFATGAFIGGSLGPGVGASITHNGFDWTVTMCICLAIALPLTIAMALLPECREHIVLQKKSQRLRFETGDWSLHSLHDEIRVNLSDYLIKPWKMLCKEPVLMVVTTAFTLDYGIQSLTYSEIPYAFQGRGWTPEYSAWALSATIFGFVIGCIAVVLDTQLRFRKRLLQGGAIAPESRLPPIIVGMMALSAGLLWFAWTAGPQASWYNQASSEVLIGIGMYMVWVTATVYVQDLYVSHANSALAACAFVRYSLGAAFPLFSSILREKIGIPWTMTSLGIMCAILVPCHVLFYFYGRKVRAWSRFALHDSYSVGQRGL